MIEIEHFENGIKKFDTNIEFIAFTQSLYIENEDWMELTEPKTVEECEKYITNYCDNFKLITPKQ